MKVKIKKLVQEAVMPSYAKESDAGMDLTAVSIDYDKVTNVFTYGTGLAVEIPPGFVGYIFPRSSIYKTGQILTNSVGVIDAGYRGEIMVKMSDAVTSGNSIYNVWDRVAQLIIMPIPTIEFEEVTELSDSERGTGGHGSTGR